MLVRASSGSGGGGGGKRTKGDTNISLTADTRVELGFPPSYIMISLHLPNYSACPWYEICYDVTTFGNSTQFYKGKTTSGGTASVPSANNTATIRSVDSSGFTMGFNPNVGGNCSFSYVAME